MGHVLVSARFRRFMNYRPWEKLLNITFTHLVVDKLQEMMNKIAKRV